ncbi:hypothetical protein Q1695_010031 [Nippostrongylus brasiliensis]|nr:hypothetical protein Q1695_010031 [Nippostrongylus brasiliensis]
MVGQDLSSKADKRKNKKKKGLFTVKLQATTEASNAHTTTAAEPATEATQSPDNADGPLCIKGKCFIGPQLPILPIIPGYGVNPIPPYGYPGFPGQFPGGFPPYGIPPYGIPPYGGYLGAVPF